jgi:hypothetical protein
MEQTIADLTAQTLEIEIRAAVAQDAFTAERARQERLYCEGQGWKAPLKAHQFRAMNRMVDGIMDRSKQAAELTAAMRALREHNWRIVRMRAGYAA